MLNNFPIFSVLKPGEDVDYSVNPFFERAALIIPIKSSGDFLVYDKFDDLYRFPGGHVEKDETNLDAAFRETSEEVGVDLNKTLGKYLLSLNNFYYFKNQPSHVLEHYFYYPAIDIKDLEKARQSETGLRRIVVSEQKLRDQNWPQINYVLDKF